MSTDEQDLLQELADLLGTGVGAKVKKVYFAHGIGFTVESELSASELTELTARAEAHGHKVAYREVNERLRLVIVL